MLTKKLKTKTTAKAAARTRGRSNAAQRLLTGAVMRCQRLGSRGVDEHAICVHPDALPCKSVGQCFAPKRSDALSTLPTHRSR